MLIDFLMMDFYLTCSKMTIKLGVVEEIIASYSIHVLS